MRNHVLCIVWTISLSSSSSASTSRRPKQIVIRIEKKSMRGESSIDWMERPCCLPFEMLDNPRRRNHLRSFSALSISVVCRF